MGSSGEPVPVALPAAASLDGELTRIRRDVSKRFQQFLAMLIERGVLPAGAAASYVPPIELQVEDFRRSGLTGSARDQKPSR
jgi:hypothetical protein